MVNDTGRAPRDQDVDVFGLSHVGKVREESEDQFLHLAAGVRYPGR